MEVNEKESVQSFTLPNKKIVVKYIPRKTGMANGDWVTTDHIIHGGMMDGSRRTFVAPLLRSGVVANVLTNEEKEYLENDNVTGLNLSVYGDFWKTQIVSLYKGDNYLDLSIPADYIAYKILLSNKDTISPDWESRNSKQTYQFAITSEDDEFLESKKALDDKKEAFKLYSKIEHDQEKLLGVLKLLTNKPISSTTSIKFLQGQIEEFIDATPKKFLNIYNDTSLETKLLINEAVDLGVIKVKGNKYITEDGLPLCENGEVPSFDNVVKYLNSPKHQEIRIVIEAKINSKK